MTDSRSTPRRARAWLGVTVFGVALGSVACQNAIGPAPRNALIEIHANVAQTPVATVVVEVTGDGITDPLAFNLTVVNGVASGTLTIPTGTDRTITIRAFDATGIETHRGTAVVDIEPGTNPPLTILLEPLSGDQPIDVILGTVRITIVPSNDTLAVGDSVVLTARVVDADSNPVPVTVRWASLDPAVVFVEALSDSTGLVTAQGAGATQVVATVAGFGAAATLTVIGGTSTTPTLVQVATGLLSPLHLTSPPGDTTRLFVAEKAGRIRVIQNGILLGPPFLDISSGVTSGGERGLLSVAFHPSYAQNGFFYVYYTDLNGDTQIVRYTVSSNPNVADSTSNTPILSLAQPFANHNGGLIAFGPDSMLYVALGDGGSGGDPDGHGQDSTTLLGALLRIDVDGGSPYAVPPDNPFAGHPSARPEIWAYGLRNPWRFSFDRQTGDLYIADVGQNMLEEVSFQPAASGGGENYGWNTMEGTACFNPATGCTQTGLVLPVFEYDHGEGCSVTGGHVYRGPSASTLDGRYFYADFCSTWVRSFRVVGGVAVDPMDHSGDFGPVSSVASFGEDARGDLYVVSMGGTVYRVVP